MHVITAAPPHELNACQEDIWMAESSVAAGGPHLTTVLSERVSGDIDPRLLRSCVERALTQNDAFSLRFDERDGIPVQWARQDPAVVEVLDFSHYPDPAAASAAWREESFYRPFALRRARMYEAALLCEGPGTVYLSLRAHRLLVDEWAMKELLHQVWADYEHTLLTGMTTSLLAPSYLGSSAATTSSVGYRSSDGGRADAGYYRHALARLEPSLFRRSPWPRDAVRLCGRRSFTVPAAVVAGIRQAARTDGPRGFRTVIRG